MKHIKNALFKAVSLFSRNIIAVYLLFGAGAFIFQGLWTKQFAAFYNVPFSQADVMIFSLDNRFFPFVIASFSAITAGSLLKNDFSAMVIVQHKSRFRFLFSNIKKVFLFSFVSALFNVGITLATAFFITDIKTNFTAKDSIVQMSNYFSRDISEPDFHFVILSVFVMMFLSLLAANLLVVLAKWISGKFIWGVGAILAISTIDLQAEFENFNGILFARNCATYSKWFDIPKMYTDSAVSLIWIAVILIAGVITVRRRDFLGSIQK